MYKIVHEKHERYTPSNLRFHDCYEILIHIRGAKMFYLSPQAVDIAPMDIFIISPHQIHGILSDGDLTDYECIHLYLTDKTMQKLGYDFVPVNNIIDNISKSTLQRISLPSDVWTKMLTLIPLLEADYHSLLEEDRIITMGALSIFLGEICKAARNSEIIPTKPFFSTFMHSVCNYITEHFTESCTLEDLAEHFSINKHHLSRSFSKTFGISIYQYVLMCRISYAKTLISQGEAFADVSAQCGFNDYSNFLRVFNMHTGMSPSKWKKMSCGNPADLSAE